MLEKHSTDVRLKDSKGRDAFMICALNNNHGNVIELLLAQLNENDKEIRSSTDAFGKSTMHYAVTPNLFSSYKNKALLSALLKGGFNHTIEDIYGKKPYDYCAPWEDMKVLFIKETGCTNENELKGGDTSTDMTIDCTGK